MVKKNESRYLSGRIYESLVTNKRMITILQNLKHQDLHISNHSFIDNYLTVERTFLSIVTGYFFFKESIHCFSKKFW